MLLMVLSSTGPTLPVLPNWRLLMNRADEFHVSVFQDSTTASTLTQRLIRSLKAPNKPSLDTLFSNTWLLEEKNGKNKLISRVSVHSVLVYK